MPTTVLSRNHAVCYHHGPAQIPGANRSGGTTSSAWAAKRVQCELGMQILRLRPIRRKADREQEPRRIIRGDSVRSLFEDARVPMPQNMRWPTATARGHVACGAPPHERFRPSISPAAGFARSAWSVRGYPKRGLAGHSPVPPRHTESHRVNANDARFGDGDVAWVSRATPMPSSPWLR